MGSNVWQDPEEYWKIIKSIFPLQFVATRQERTLAWNNLALEKTETAIALSYYGSVGSDV